MAGIDLGVDENDQHVIPAVDTVGFKKVQLANNILLGARVRRGILFD